MTIQVLCILSMRDEISITRYHRWLLKQGGNVTPIILDVSNIASNVFTKPTHAELLAFVKLATTDVKEVYYFLNEKYDNLLHALDKSAVTQIPITAYRKFPNDDLGYIKQIPLCNINPPLLTGHIVFNRFKNQYKQTGAWPRPSESLREYLIERDDLTNVISIKGETTHHTAIGIYNRAGLPARDVLLAVYEKWLRDRILDKPIVDLCHLYHPDVPNDANEFAYVIWCGKDAVTDVEILKIHNVNHG